MIQMPHYEAVHFGGNHTKLHGDGPSVFWGTVVPDGDAAPWVNVAVGSVYHYQNGGDARAYTKAKSDGADNDWVAGLGCITATVAYSAFTDGGSTAGTYALADTIPVGATVLRTSVLNVTGFTGNTSAVLTVGDGSDVDRYNTGTPSVFATASAVDMGAVSGTAYHTSAATVTLTVTSATDFTSVSAGSLTIRIFYLL